MSADSLDSLTEITKVRSLGAADAAQQKFELRVRSSDIVVKYKARPLNGIWATAPYLHNGSIPNLKALLTAVAERPRTFRTGSREYDVTNVGFDPLTGPFTYDTSVKGNSNQGHAFGVSLSEAQKLDLIEYLKSL